MCRTTVDNITWTWSTASLRRLLVGRPLERNGLPIGWIAWIVVGAIVGFLANLESIVIATLGAAAVLLVMYLATGGRGLRGSWE